MLGHVLGDLNRSSSGRLEGWCWANDRPRDRLVVEVLLNGEIAASLTAARLDISLQETGIGDGYHAFSLPMPNLPTGQDDGCVIEARERMSRSIFGRIVLSSGSAYALLKQKLAEVDREIQLAMHHPNPSSQKFQNGERFLQVRDLGLLLKNSGRSLGRIKKLEPARSMRVCRQLINELPDLVLPWITNPSLSLIVPASMSWKDTRSGIRNIAEILATYDSELIIVDNGDDPLTALAAAHIRNLNYVFHPGAMASVAARNAAALIARGRHLCFLDDIEIGAIRALTAAGWFANFDLSIGPLPSQLARRLGLDRAFRTSEYVDHAFNMNMCVKASVFDAVQGFDETLRDPSLAAVDFAMKAALSKKKIVIAQSYGYSYASQNLLQPEELSAFNTRWGNGAAYRVRS